MSNNDTPTPKKKERYICLPHSTTHIVVDDDVYHAYYDPQNQLLSKMRKDKQCVCPVRSWFVCINDCYACKFYRSRTLSLDADNAIKIADTSASPEEEHLQKEINHHLYEALYKLAPRDQLIVYYYIEGYSRREIARKLGTPWSTFQSHFQKILRQLKENMQEYH